MTRKTKLKFNAFCMKLFKFVSRLIVILLFLLVVLVTFFSINEFPDFLVRQGLKIPNKSSFYFDVERVQLNFFSGVVLKNIYVYRKEKAGEAGVYIKTLVVDINWFDLFQKNREIRKVRFLNTTVKSRQLIVPAKDGEGGLPPAFNLFVDSEMYFKDLYLDGVWFQEISADAKCRGSKLFVTHIDGSLGSLDNPGTFRNSSLIYDSSKAVIDINLDAKLNPYFLVPLFNRWGNTTLVDFIHRFDKETMNNTDFEGTINRNFNNEDSMLLEGLFEVAGSSYNGINFLTAKSLLTISTSKTGSSIKGERCYVGKEKGNVYGNFITKDDYSDVTFQGTSTIEPVELLQLMNIKNKFVETVDFKTRPNVTATGVVCPDNYTNNSFNAKVDEGNFAYSNFYFSAFKSDISVKGTTNSLKNFNSDFYDGKLAGDLTFNILDNTFTNVQYNGNFILDKANYSLFAAALDIQKSEEVSGRLYGQVELNGYLCDDMWSKMNASGYFSIKKGWLFRMNIFGGLTKLLANIIPGLDFVMSQSDATIDFKMENGIVDVTKFVLNGDVLSISGRGSVNMVNRTLNMKFQIKFMKQHTFVAKFVNTIVWPISKLFEMKLTGTLEKPVWESVNF